MSWDGTVFPWLAILAVAVLALLALMEALFPPSTMLARRSRIAAAAVFGSLAFVVTILRQLEAHEGPRAALWPRLAESAGISAPQRTAGRAAILEHAIARLNALRDEKEALRVEVAVLEKKVEGRSIGSGTAAKLEAYLAHSGSREVAVTSLSGDAEAYRYANEIVDILKKAGWKAAGPEATMIFGSAPAMGINLYVPQKTDADTANILTSAFTRFDIPYESRVMPSGTVPEPGVVQLFISRMP